jgi:hypothetical protein
MNVRTLRIALTLDAIFVAGALTAQLTSNPPVPPAPLWTRCTTTWSWAITTDSAGVRSWKITTLMKPEDVSDLDRACRWYDSVVAQFPQFAEDYSWLNCGGFRIRDWLLHGTNIPPLNFFGEQGLNSPLGLCHSRTSFKRMELKCDKADASLGCVAVGAWSTTGTLGGTLGTDGIRRGLVLYHNKLYVGTVVDGNCTDACAVEYDHPCELDGAAEVGPYVRSDMNHAAFYTWWLGGDPNNPPSWPPMGGKR